MTAIKTLTGVTAALHTAIYVTSVIIETKEQLLLFESFKS